MKSRNKIIPDDLKITLGGIRCGITRENEVHQIIINRIFPIVIHNYIANYFGSDLIVLNLIRPKRATNIDHFLGVWGVVFWKKPNTSLFFLFGSINFCMVPDTKLDIIPSLGLTTILTS